MVETDTLFQTKTAEKNIPFGAAHTHIHIAYIRDYSAPGGAKNGLQIMSLAAYTSETNYLNVIINNCIKNNNNRKGENCPQKCNL